MNIKYSELQINSGICILFRLEGKRFTEKHNLHTNEHSYFQSIDVLNYSLHFIIKVPAALKHNITTLNLIWPSCYLFMYSFYSN